MRMSKRHGHCPIRGHYRQQARIYDGRFCAFNRFLTECSMCRSKAYVSRVRALVLSNKSLGKDIHIRQR